MNRHSKTIHPSRWNPRGPAAYELAEPVADLWQTWKGYIEERIAETESHRFADDS